MADQSLKDFNNQWILFGVLFVCLISFATMFMAANNANGLGSSQDKFDAYSSDMNNKLVVVPDTGNTLLNVSAQNNPEAGLLGSRDSVATSYGIFGNAKGFWDSFKLFAGWMLSNDAGKMLIAVLVGMFSLGGLYWITKWIRTGT